MPSRKPSALNKRHDTKDEKAHRAAAESAMTPNTELSLKPPPVLNGHKVAKETWARVVGLYHETEGKIATSFDENALVEYCLVVEELPWLRSIRRKVEKEYIRLHTRLSKVKADDKDTLLKVLSQVNALLTRLQGFDARIDGKRKLAKSYEESLYLIPRSRAGVEPPLKEQDEPKSDIENFM